MGAKRLAPPNYTQAPNEFFDEIMPEITSMAELKVTLTIVRQTFGYHKDEDRLSLSRLVELTGLSRKSVAEGVKLALSRGYVGRRKVGNTYHYGLRVASEESTPFASEESTPTKEREKEIDEEITSPLRLTAQVTESIEHLQQTDHFSDTSKAIRSVRKLINDHPDVDAAEICRDYEAWVFENGEPEKPFAMLRSKFQQAAGIKPSGRRHLRAVASFDPASNSEEARKRRVEGYEWLFEGSKA